MREVGMAIEKKFSPGGLGLELWYSGTTEAAEIFALMDEVLADPRCAGLRFFISVRSADAVLNIGELDMVRAGKYCSDHSGRNPGMLCAVVVATESQHELGTVFCNHAPYVKCRVFWTYEGATYWIASELSESSEEKAELA